MSDAAQLLSALTSTERSVRTLRATVSAYREDGTVNLRYGTAQIFGVPCLESYTNRRLGDVVQVLDLGNSAWLVLGRIGGIDPDFVGPDVQNVTYRQYHLYTLAVRSAVNEAGLEGFVGAPEGGAPALLAWSYFSGGTNALNAAASAAGKTGMVVTVARSSVLHGQREAVELQLCPHNYDTLPTSTITLDTESFTEVAFRLEVGEIRHIPIPTDWWGAMKGVSPTIRGFAVRPITPDPWYAGYALFSPISGGFRTF